MKASYQHGENFIPNAKSLSKISKLILFLFTVVISCSFVLIIAPKKLQYVAILLFVFIQPIIILYFVFWRERRNKVSLDLVVKCYAFGFGFTSFQSILLESILQVIFTLLSSPFMNISVAINSNDMITVRNVEKNNLSLNLYSRASNNIRNRLFFSNNLLFNILAVNDGIHIYASSSCNRMEVTGDDYSQINNSAVSTNNLSRNVVKQHIVVVIIGLILMAYVVAAGVKEAMKHLVVRSYQFSTALKDPSAVLVLLLSSALGFATLENIEYVFITNTSPSSIQGTSMFVGDLFVLLVRVFMPVPVICSVLQAVNLSKVLFGHVEMSLFQILLPALLLHGTFDFTLFLMRAIEYIYDIENIALEIICIIITSSLTIGGTIHAYNSFKKVEEDHDSKDGIFWTDKEEERFY